MTTCVYCNPRKGKRDCPALGAICSPCCGEHRVDDMPCPPACPHLGVDALRLPSQGTHVLNDEALRSAVQKLSEFQPPADWREDIQGAFDLVGDMKDMPLWGKDVAARFVIGGYRRPDGGRLIDRFLKVGRNLTIEEARGLAAISRSVASLYKITRLRPPSTVSLRNLLSGERFGLSSEVLVEELGKGAVLFGWVMDRGDRKEFDTPELLIPSHAVSAVSRAFRKALRLARAQFPSLAEAELGGTAAYAVLDTMLDEVAWAEEVAEEMRWLDDEDDEDAPPQGLPQMTNTNGEDLVVATARYAIAGKPAALRKAFSGREDLEAIKGGFDWIMPTGKRIQGVPEMLCLGKLTIGKGQLVLEVNSLERLARGRALVEDLAGALVQHLSDTIEEFDPLRLDSRGPFRDTPGGYPVSEELQRQIAKEYLSQRYLEWVDEPLPALHGATPREAVRTKAGRAQVAEIVEFIEAGTRRFPGGEEWTSTRCAASWASDSRCQESPPTLL